MNFNPRTPDGVRHSLYLQRGAFNPYFNPRTPDGVRPERQLISRGGSCHFNPRTPDGVRQDTYPHSLDRHRISIHAPLTGCDVFGFN